MGAGRVVNLHKTKKFDVYVGRPSIWGNPFSHLPDTLAEFRVASREEAILAYEKWILAQPDFLALVPTLKGRILGCWCWPLPCHAEILVRLSELMG